MARSSRRKSHRPDRRSSRDRRERSDSEEEQGASSKGRRQRDDGAARIARDSESDRRKSTPARLENDKEGPSGLASGESSGEGGKKRKERSGNASDNSAAAAAAANRWNGDTDAAATVLEEKYMTAKEITDAEKTAKLKLLPSESRSKSSKRYDGSHSDRRDDDASRDESSRRRSEKESSRRASGRQQSDQKESERIRGSSGNKEYQVSMDKDSSREASRDGGREHVKDKDRPSGRERNGGAEIERDNVSEKSKAVDKEEKSRRDKEHRSNSETKQHCGRGKDIDDNPEKLTSLTSKISKLGCAGGGDDVWPKDLGNTDGNTQDKSYRSDLHKEANKQGKRDGPVDKEKRQGEDMDHVGRSLTRTAPSIDGIHHARESNDKRHSDKSGEDVGREQSPSDIKRPFRSSRDHHIDKVESKPYRGVDQCKENRRQQDNAFGDRSCGNEYSDKYVDGREKKKLSVEKDKKTKSANNNQSSDYNDDRSRPDSQHSSRIDSARPIHKNSPSSAIDSLHDEYRHNQRHVETVLPAIPKERQHASSCSSGDFASGFGLVDKAYDCHSVESGSKQKEKARSTDFPTKESPASQHNSTPKSENHISAPRFSEKLTSTGDRDNFNRKGAKRSLDVADFSHRGGYLSDDMGHAAVEERRHEVTPLKQTPDGNTKIQLSGSDTTRSSSSLYNRSDPVSSNQPDLLPAFVRPGISSPSAKSLLDDDSRAHSNDRRSSIRYKRAGDSHLGRGQGSNWNGAVPSWLPQFANGFMPFQHGPPGIQPVGQPYPSPSVFGVGPFMDFNLSRVPFHIHENPDRFSGHARPVGWCNPSDGPYPSRSQGWEGMNGSLGNDTSTYGRHDMDQAKTLTSNGGQVMDGNKQLGSNTEFIQAKKESATSVQTRGNNLGSERCVGGTEEHDLGKGMTQSHDTTRAKENVESSPKMPKSPKSTTNSVDTCERKYSSKLDISHDLAPPELCRDFISLLGKECQSPCNNVKNEIQGPIERFKMTVGGANPVDKPLFPVLADALFKKAFSLYNKNRGKPEDDHLLSEEMGASAPVQTGSSNAATAETEPLVNRCSEYAIKQVKKEPSEITDAEFAGSGETKRSEISEHQPEPNSSSYVKMEDGSYDTAAIRCGVGNEVLPGFDSDSILRCESLVLGCLSRIPNSPENTR